MPAARNAETKRVTSIARAINWSYLWRRLVSYVWLDLLLLVVAAAILVYGYNQTLPDGAFTAGWIPGAAVHGMSLTPVRSWGLATLTYTVELAHTTKTFPLGHDLIALWPLYLVVAGGQVISVLDMLGGARRVRRTMATPTTSMSTSRTCAPRSRTPVAPALSRPCAGWAMPAARNAETKRVTSIARAINWSYLWRRLVSYVWLDLLLLVVAAAILVYGYNQTLPDGAFTAGWIPGAAVHGMSLTPVRSWGLATLTYTVELAHTTKTFPLGHDLIALWPLYLVVAGGQVISVLDMLGGARRVRRTMAPLNDLALRVDELGRMQLAGGKMETLEQAIERASVDSPSVTTGDADLASIEVALNRLLRQMQEAKLQQMRFVNDASHELRTPIAVIQGYVNMLDRWGKDDPDVLAESIASLKAESEHMQELVEQLLFLARGDAGRTVLRRANTNLAALVGEVCEESQMIDTEHTYRLAYDTALASDARCDAPIDVALAKQALRVIVQNAAKYSDAGTAITFGVAPDTGAGAIDINVEDEGIGMNQESAAHAFERFYRADNARDAGAQGSGLGLAIAKWIVDSHGGVIGVTSVEGVGSRFTIRLPR